MEVVDDDVDEVEAEETVFTGTEDAMLDSMSGDMTDSANEQNKWANKEQYIGAHNYCGIG